MRGGRLNSMSGGGATIVSPDNMRGWAFYDDQAGTACSTAGTCSMVSGPGTPPGGSASAQLSTSTTSDGKALILSAYRGTRLSSIGSLSYATYRQSSDPANNLAISLQFNIDYDLDDTTGAYQGRLVFEPYQGAGGTVTQGSWQTWDAKAGRWWGTRSSVTRGNTAVTNPCVQATPCTWSEVLAAFPSIGVHATLGAVVLKAGSGWGIAFQGNVDKLTIAITGGATTTYDFELTDPFVVGSVPPAQRPHFPAGGEIQGGSAALDSVQRGAVIVQFYEGTPQALRQAAVDAVQGVVIGGNPVIDGDGFYYLSIPDDGTSASLVAALHVLDTLPQVELATPIDVNRNDAAYLRPIDGHPDYRSWAVTPSQAGGLNWGLERVRAPLAWGCSTGSLSTNIGVLDFGTDTVATDGSGAVITDLARNTAFVSGIGTGSNGSLVEHGREVASILAARGNDSIGMTGMMWKASLLLVDRYSDPQHPGQLVPAFVGTRQVDALDTFEQHVVNLGLRGAQVINISQAAPWRERLVAGQPPSFGNPDDIAIAQRYRNALSAALRRLAARGYTPLIVLAAGNFNLDAYWSGFALSAVDFPDQVIVVGASDQTDGRWTASAVDGSNLGSRVDLYAPGVGIGAHNGRVNGTQIVPTTGTSVAAPLVAGVAGLLKSLDPSLSSRDIKRLIVEGAQRRGVAVSGGKYLLDAYEALKGAGRRVGGPICGNHIYIDGNSRVVIERRTGPTTWIDDQIPAGDFSDFGPGAQQIGYVVHNGHYFDVPGFTLEFRNNTWIRTPQDIDTTFARIPSHATDRMSHDGDSLMAVVMQTRRTPFSFQLGVRDTAGHQRTVGPVLPGYVVSLAFPLMGDEAVVSVAPTTFGTTATILGFNIVTGTVRTIYNRPGDNSLSNKVYVSESGDEFLMEFTGPFPDFPTCFSEWRSMVDGSLIRQVQRPQRTGCDEGFLTDVSALNRKPSRPAGGASVIAVPARQSGPVRASRYPRARP